MHKIKTGILFLVILFLMSVASVSAQTKEVQTDPTLELTANTESSVSFRVTAGSQAISNFGVVACVNEEFQVSSTATVLYEDATEPVPLVLTPSVEPVAGALQWQVKFEPANEVLPAESVTTVTLDFLQNGDPFVANPFELFAKAGQSEVTLSFGSTQCSPTAVTMGQSFAMVRDKGLAIATTLLLAGLGFTAIVFRKKRLVLATTLVGLLGAFFLFQPNANAITTEVTTNDFSVVGECGYRGDKWGLRVKTVNVPDHLSVDQLEVGTTDGIRVIQMAVVDEQNNRWNYPNYLPYKYPGNIGVSLIGTDDGVNFTLFVEFPEGYPEVIPYVMALAGPVGRWDYDLTGCYGHENDN